MHRFTIALFGEAERGEYKTPHLLNDLGQLADRLGHPPTDSVGLHFAIQALLYQRQLLFFRVEEEGYSVGDYLQGLDLLRHAEDLGFTALYMPGVGNTELIELSSHICTQRRSFLLFSENDFYDYLTS